VITCSECGKDFHPWRERMFEHYQTTCGNPDCQRARKTRLQRERRMKQRPAGDCLTKQRGSTVPQMKQRRPTLPRAKGPGWGNALKQRRSSLPQPPEAR
jgi:hypothetical protein